MKTFCSQAISSLTPSLYLFFLALSSKITNNHIQLVQADQGQDKPLVLFAGPHYAASTSITTFFQRHPLPDWSWPAANKDQFALVVTKPDDVHPDLFQRIQNQWEDPTKTGMLVGTAEFDRVGSVPWSHRDGIAGMESIISQVGLSNNPTQVTVVVNYRAPRIEQWISVFKHETNATHDHYRKFLCVEPQSDDGKKIWEILDTSMNPLSLVIEYRKRGWNVVLIDMAGVSEKGFDISHTIACEVLNVPCNIKPGFIDQYQQATVTKNHIDRDFESIDETHQDQLDQLFGLRDCTYQGQIENDSGVTILHQDKLWQDCPASIDSGKFQQLHDTDLIYDVIRSQKTCSKGSVTMDDFLSTFVDGGTTTSVDSIHDDAEELEEALIGDNGNKFGAFGIVAVMGMLSIFGFMAYRMSLVANENIKLNQKDDEGGKYSSIQLSRIEAASRIAEASNNQPYRDII